MCEARNFAACADEICGTGREIWGARLEGGFRATRRGNKICSVKYDAKFYVAAHGDKIDGAMADKKGLGAALANVRNFGLKNARVNLRPWNTYADLKFKGSANSKPAGDLNFKFKNNASPRLLCGGNARSIKSRSRANALSFSAAAEISAPVRAGEILKYGVMAGISALALASKILIPSIAGKILNLSAASCTDFGPKGAGGC